MRAASGLHRVRHALHVKAGLGEQATVLCHFITACKLSAVALGNHRIRSVVLNSSVHNEAWLAIVDLHALRCHELAGDLVRLSQRNLKAAHTRHLIAESGTANRHLSVHGALVAAIVRRGHLELAHLARRLRGQGYSAHVGRGSRRVLHETLLLLIGWRRVNLLQLLLQHLMRIRRQAVQMVNAADALEVTELVVFLVLVVRGLAHDALIEVVVCQL